MPAMPCPACNASGANCSTCKGKRFVDSDAEDWLASTETKEDWNRVAASIRRAKRTKD